MTSITALNVRLGMDVSNFSEGANLAKAETNRVAAIMRQSAPTSEKYKKDLDLINRAFSETGKQSKDYANAVEFLAKKHQIGAYSAESLTKAEQAAAEVAKRLKEETSRLAAEEQKKQAAMDRGKQVLLSVRSAQEKHTYNVREYLKLLKSGAITQETYNRAVLKSQQAMHAATRATKDNSVATKSALSSIKQMAAAYISFQAVTKSINLATQVEDATIAFEVLTGSVNDGKVLFDQVRDFAERSPITFTNATQATKTMMSFGVAVEDIQKNLQMLSDVTGGNNERFKNLSLAFSQMTSAGRLLGQDLRQMVDAGFNPLQQISKMTGESLIDLKARMEDGSISSDEVRAAFEVATDEGGMFHGMTERLAETVGGKLNIALSDLEKKAAAAGKAMAPLIITLLDAFTQLEPVLTAVVSLIGRISKGLGFAVALITDLINSITSFSVDTTAMDNFLDMLDQEDRDRAAAAAEQVQKEFDQKKKAAEDLAAAEKKAIREVEAERLKAIEEAKHAQQAALLQSANVAVESYLKAIKTGSKAEQMNALMAAKRSQDAYIKSVAGEEKASEKALQWRLANIEKERKARMKAAEDEQKRVAAEMKKLDEAFTRDVQKSVEAAHKFYEDEKKNAADRRKDVAAGPGAGIEVGSAESVRFFADDLNRRIGGAAVPEKPTPGEAEIVNKAKDLFRQQQKANAIMERQVAKTEELVQEMKQNGFRRIR